MRTLLIDTCGDVGSVALADGAEVIALSEMPARSASAAVVHSIQSLLRSAGWSRRDIQGVGVVNGPGSFTGVRVGLAGAKGLCEALNIPIATVSRLQVLASAANMKTGSALLNAGRSDVYVLDVERAVESLRPMAALLEERTERLVFAEPLLASQFSGPGVEICEINAASAAVCVMQRFSQGPRPLELADANYVRDEQQIYRSTSSVEVVTT